MKYLLLCLLSFSWINAQDLSEQMQRFTQLFEGEFDNYKQIHLEKESKAEFPHEHIHSVFAKVNAPVFGENVFYVKQYMNGDPKKLYRQRLYSFSKNEVENAIELKIYSFPTDSLFIDSHLFPEKLANESPQTLTSYAGCEVFWQPDADGFKGYMKDNACKVVSKRSGKTIIITDNLKLNPDEIWIQDEAKDEQGNYVFGHKGGEPHKLKRCHYFKGWILLQKEIGSETEDFYALRGLRWHNQGQRITMTDEAGNSLGYEVELAEVSYRGTLSLMKLAFYKTGEEKSFIYTWASPDTQNIGINLRWIQAGLTKE